MTINLSKRFPNKNKMTENNHKCDKCGREFSSKEALEMHKNSKHYEAPSGVKKIKNINKKKMRNWIIVIAVIVIIVAVAYVWASKSASADGKYDEFAKCLAGNNVTMYGAWWCTHCKDQKKAFGSSFQYINYIECSTSDGNAMLQVCQDAKIDGYPTWNFADGTRKSGFVPLKELALAGNCTLP